MFVCKRNTSYSIWSQKRVDVNSRYHANTRTRVVLMSREHAERSGPTTDERVEGSYDICWQLAEKGGDGQVVAWDEWNKAGNTDVTDWTVCVSLIIRTLRVV
jgi:hypothetical protein